MFYSLVQTIVCVLLIQGGLYALHLNGPSGTSTNVGGSVSGGGVGTSASASSGMQRTTAPLSDSGVYLKSASTNNNQMLNILSATQHAQHLHAGGSGSGSGGSNGGGISGRGGGFTHTLSKSAASPLDNAGRLSQELADIAQLERERLMLLGLAKQTAAENVGKGHHGRPIITGRIQMSPAEEVDGNYASLLLQQPRGPLYGSIVKEPAPVEEDEYADEEGFGDAYQHERLHGGVRRRPEKYEYGRIVQPADREEYEQAQRVEELDELIEAEPEIDDMLTDLDSYQYLDELLPPEQRNLWGEDALAYAVVGGNTRPHHLNDGLPLLLNPYRTLEEFEANKPHTLQEIFQKGTNSGGIKEHERVGHSQQNAREQQARAEYQVEAQRQQREPQHHQTQQETQQSQHIFKEAGTKQRNSGYGNAGYPSHMQLKWQRKRSQQQQQQRQLHQWQRNIFAQQQKQLHHFNTQPQRHSKLSLANSEATATKHIQPNNNNNNNKNVASAFHAMTPQQQSSSSKLTSKNDAVTKSEQQQDQIQRTQQQPTGEANADNNVSSTSTLTKTSAKLKTLQEQQQQQQHTKQQQTSSLKQESFLHLNHKRSGSIGSSAAGSMSTSAAAALNNGYSSMASQLMLRTVRGQRQYDVPQIGKCKFSIILQQQLSDT
ncbi:transcriptional regulator ovo isoform X2 [Eurosta solidaginis]|uniref:transcriptional regulator ovo isoform X2 n=1 Tax=Eurosta solidaginis TaxID=178769 RepID=UPI003530D249